MKKVNNIYDELIDTKKIVYMYDRVIKINTKNKNKLEKFEYNYVSNISYIKSILESKNYNPGKYNIFIIREPKVRLIMSQNIIDKVINHLVSKYILVKYFENSLVDSNVATRKNKGTNYGLKLLKKYINEIKKDGEFYILKFDISKFFYNVDHDILKNIISNKIKDKDALDIIYKIIDSTDLEYINNTINKIKKNEIEKINNKNINNKDSLIKSIKEIPLYNKGKGLCIGSMSSQFMAILYNDKICHYIKEKLHIKYFLLYMDDGIILHKDKKYLEYCLEEINKLFNKYKLKLNNKTKIFSSKEGIEFLGFRFIINNKTIIKVKNQTKKKFKRKMKKLYKLIDEKIISYNELLCVKSSYIGHLKYGNTNKLINKVLNKNNLYEFESCIKEVRI